MSWFTKERQRFIKELVDTQGHVNRKDIMSKFNVSIATASLDLTTFQKKNPGKLFYSNSRKRYFKSERSSL